MAQANRANKMLSAIAGAAFAAGAMLAPGAATAQDATPVAMDADVVKTILCETDRKFLVSDGWTSQVADLRCASDAARDYAENSKGLGILIHVGMDLPNKHFASADQFGKAMVALLRNKYGIEAQYFLRQNDARATGITYHINDLIHGAGDGTEVKNVKEAIAAIPNALGLLALENQDKLKQDKIAQAPIGITPQPPGS